MSTGAVRALLHGRVQGVYFRDYAKRKALALSLVGYARNLPNGVTVEVYAEGEEADLKSLIAELHQGPGTARVDRVEAEWQQPRGELDTFEVVW